MDGDSVLYHFMSLATFSSILHSGVFKLFDVSKSNDPLECKFHMSALENMYREMYRDDSIDEKTYHKFHKNYYIFSEEHKALGGNRDVIMTGSFCTLSHELSKWRAYGDNGKGIAIGVSKNTLSYIANEYNIELKKVKYMTVSEMNHHAREFWKSCVEFQDVDIQKLLEKYLIEGYFFKEKANEDEEEYRLLSKYDMSTHTLPGIVWDVPQSIGIEEVNNQLKVCTNINIKKQYNGNGFIQFINIGPQCGASSLEIQLLGNKLGYSFNGIERSRIMMR